MSRTTLGKNNVFFPKAGDAFTRTRLLPTFGVSTSLAAEHCPLEPAVQQKNRLKEQKWLFGCFGVFGCLGDSWFGGFVGLGGFGWVWEGGLGGVGWFKRVLVV